MDSGVGEVDGGRRPCAAARHVLALVLLSGESGDCVESAIRKGHCWDRILEILAGQGCVCQVGAGLSVHAVSMSPSSGKYFTQSP